MIADGQLIFLWGLCGYLWVDILILSPLRTQNFSGAFLENLNILSYKLSLAEVDQLLGERHVEIAKITAGLNIIGKPKGDSGSYVENARGTCSN